MGVVFVSRLVARCGLRQFRNENVRLRMAKTRKSEIQLKMGFLFSEAENSAEAFVGCELLAAFDVEAH